MRTHLDLFAGIGGFAIAAQACGFKTVAFCEIDPYAQQILIEKFGAVMEDAESIRCNEAGAQQSAASDRPRLHRDIFAIDGTQYRGVSLLTGGFPCQPFSVAGKRRGAADDRALWPEMFRVIREAKPSAVLAENVPGIITMELDRCLSDLESIGYACWPIVIPACAVDARHRRDRVWIVAHAKESRQPRRKRSECARRCESNRSSEIVADGFSPRLEERQEQPAREERQTAQRGCVWPDEAEWFPQSAICRVAHGIPNRTHRLRALGNAIVPQVAEEIIRCMIANP